MTDPSPPVTPTEPQPLPSTTVRRAGDEVVPGYPLVKPLGRGGFGEVWQATAPGGIPVALKFVPWTGSLGEKERRALNLLRDLRHPHLLATTAYWHQGDSLVLALELADGTLNDRLNEATAAGLPGIPADELLRFMIGAAKGLDYLNHPPAEGGTGPGVQHRDIKPHNLLRVGGEVKVADFGLARKVTGEATSHTGSATWSFAPPEFFAGKTSRHSDQYSLAMTYCLLRGGRLPYAGGNRLAMIAARAAPDLSMLPEEERPAVTRALAIKPGDRWPSCGAFIEDLGGRIGSNLPSNHETAKHSSSPYRVAVAAGIAVLIATGGWFYHWRGAGRAPGTPPPSSSPVLAPAPPDGIAALIQRATSNYRQGDYAQAVADCTEAIRLDPDSALAYAHRAHAFHALGKPTEGLSDAKQAVKLAPGEPMGYYSRGHCYKDLKQPRPALKDLDEAIRLKLDWAVAHYVRGTVRFDAGEYNSAVDDFTEAIRLDSKFAKSYRHRGAAKAKLGDQMGAAADRKKAEELDRTMNLSQPN
jgi:serine/threonine protein kinase